MLYGDYLLEVSGVRAESASAGDHRDNELDGLAYEPERDIGDPDLPPPPDGDASGEVREVNNQLTSFIDGSSTYGPIDSGAVTDLSTEEGAGGDSVILVDIIGASAAANGSASDHAVADDLAYEPERDIGDPDLPPPPDGGRTGEQGGGDIIGARTAANGGASDHAVADDLAYEPERDIGDPDLPPPPDGGRTGHDDDGDDIIGPSITADDAGGYRWFHEYSGGSDTAASGGASDHAVADDLAYESERDIGDPDLPPPPDGDASGEVREVNNQLTSFIDGSSTYGSIDRGAVTDLSTEERAGGDSVILVDIIGASAAANGGASDHAVADDLAYEPERDIGDPDLPPPPDGGRTGEQGGGDIIGASAAANGGASDHAVADDLAYEPERDIGDPDLPPPPDGGRTGEQGGGDIIGASAAANGGASDHAVADDLAYEPERDIGDPDLPPPPDGGRTGEQGGGDIIGARTTANGGASDHAVADDLAYEPERDIGDPDLPPPPDGGRTGDDGGADSFVFAESTDNAAEYGDAGEQVYLAVELINPRSGETVDHIDLWVGGISELPAQDSGGDTLVHEVGHWAAADLDCHFDENGELFCVDLL